MDRLKTLDMFNSNANRIQDGIFVQRILNGEREIYGLLVRSHYQTLRRVIRCHLKEERDVEEVLRKTLIRAYQILSHFNNRLTFSHWLINIGIIESRIRIDELQTTDPFYSDDDDLYDEIVKASKYRNRSGFSNEGTGRVSDHENLLDQLPRKCRIVYALKNVGGMENREIAQCLRMRTADVKATIRAVRFLLKKLLSEHSDSTVVLHRDVMAAHK